MRQFVLDDQLNATVVLIPIQKRTPALFLRDLRPHERILDERVPEILRTLQQPTFLTIDQAFWKRTLCHPGYCVLYFALTDQQQRLLPPLLRAVLRCRAFRTRALRMGKVARITPTFIEWWQFKSAELHRIPSKPQRRKR